MCIIFRKATKDDLSAVDQLYDLTHDAEEQGLTQVGWVRGIYPTIATAQLGLEKGDLFVAVDQGCIVGCARINQEQMEEYKMGEWDYPVEEKAVMVLHTLTITPECRGKGYGREFLSFYERYAIEHGCTCARMDTGITNLKARKMYERAGYKEVGVVQTNFNGINNISLILLEKKLI